MVHGAVHYFLRGILAIALLVVILIAALGIRLSQGPLSLDFLNDTIQNMLSDPDHHLTARLDQTVLTFVPEGDLVDIRLRGLRLYMGGELPLATVPEASVSISGAGLLRGQVLPDSVEFYHPHLALVRDEFGNFQWNIADSTQTETPESAPNAASNAEGLQFLLDFITGEPDYSSPLQALRRFEIVGATLDMEDLGTNITLKARDVNLLLERDDHGVLLEQSLALDADGEASTVSSSLTWKRNNGELSGVVRLNQFRPALFANWGKIGETLSMANFPLFGDLKIRGNLALVTAENSPPHVTSQLDLISLNLAGGEGMLNLPDLNWHQAVKSLALRAEVRNNGRDFDLNEARLAFASGPEVMVAAHVTDIDPATSTINGKAEIEAALYEVSFNDLPALWPAGVADNARDWIVANLSDGIVPEATAKIIANFPDGRLENLQIESVTGSLEGKGISVNYLSPMPKVVNASATGTFDASTLTLNITGGEVFALRVVGGTVILSGLDQEDQSADIALDVVGPATDVLVLIDHKPLGYASALGLKPDTVRGNSVTHLHMVFPLLKDLLLDDLKVNVESGVTDLFIPKILMGLDLTDGNLNLIVDTKGLDAKGNIKLGGIAGDLIWRENFSLKDAAFASRYQVQVPDISNEQRLLLGLKTIPFIPPWLDGPVGGTVIATSKAGGKTEIKANIDMTRAAMRMVGLGWRKAIGQPARADIQVDLTKGVLSSIPAFTLTGPDMHLSGNGRFNAKGGLQRIDLASLRYGKNDGTATILFDDQGGMDISIRAAGLDGGTLLSGDPEDRGKPKDRSQPPVRITMDIGKLWFSDTTFFRSVKGEIALAGGEATKARIDAITGQSGRIQVDIRPESPKRRKLVIVSDDAGAVLNALDVTNSVRGGILDLYGYYDDQQANNPLSGELRIRDFYMVDAPVLAKVLTVAALTGIGDALRGEGMHFEELSSHFTFVDSKIKLSDLKAYGASIGMTTAGEINLNNDTLALQGVIIPAYSINRVLGEIPIIGWLLTAGDTGGGLLAVNYSVSGSTKDPEVLVNPLSALTPGFLRYVFNIFDEAQPPKAPPSATPDSPAAGTPTP